MAAPVSREGGQVIEALVAGVLVTMLIASDLVSRECLSLDSTVSGLCTLASLFFLFLLLSFLLAGLSDLLSNETPLTWEIEDGGAAVAFGWLQTGGAATAAAAQVGKLEFMTLGMACLVTLGIGAIPFNTLTSSSSLLTALISSLMHLVEVSLMFWISST